MGLLYIITQLLIGLLYVIIALLIGLRYSMPLQHCPSWQSVIISVMITVISVKISPMSEVVIIVDTVHKVDLSSTLSFVEND